MSLRSDITRSVDDSAAARLLITVRALADAAKRVTSREEFFRVWISEVRAATQAESASVLELTPTGFRTLGRVGPATDEVVDDELATRRDQRRRQVVESREPMWISEPDSTPIADAVVSDRITLVTPFVGGQTSDGIAEVTVPATTSPQRRRGCTNFVVQAMEFADDYLLREQVRDLSQGRLWSDEALHFVSAVHACTDLQPTAFVVANESRRLMSCDRVTVLIRQGQRYRVAAISGQDTFDERSPLIKAMAALAEAVAKIGEPFESGGETGSIPPPLEKAYSSYVEESHSQLIAVAPLASKRADNSDAMTRTAESPFGLLVLERRQSKASINGSERMALITESAAAALDKALTQEQIFLMPLWRKVGRIQTWMSAPTARRKTLAVALLVTAIIGVLLFVPAEFTLHAYGTFQPVERRNVFAPFDGTVTKLHVRHGDRVAADTPLIELRNTDLEVEANTVSSERTSAGEQLAAVERALFGDRKQMTPEENVRLSGQREELRQKAAALEAKLRLLDEKRGRLRIVSPIAGEIVTWNAERLLNARPVQQGQTLLTVADTTHAWELELYLPEHYVGHLTRAHREASQPLPVRFRLTSNPAREFVGTIKEIEGAAQVRGDQGNTVLVTAVIDASQLPPLKPGLEATAKVVCGRRSVGYVWLHDFVDFLKAKVLFRLF